jgi:hypothetical protein
MICWKNYNSCITGGKDEHLTAMTSADDLTT